jgi:hypothetical protein
MKIKTTQTKLINRGLTLVEVLVVLFALIVLSVMFFFWSSPTRKSLSIICHNNLRQVGSALITYANDNSDKFPCQVSVTNGGTMEIIGNARTFPHFQKLARVFTNDLKALICPYDSRKPAAQLETLTDSNISYFINADADRNSATDSILSGDRFLQSDGVLVVPGLFLLTTTKKITWATNIHKVNGSVLLADGSVQQMNSRGWVTLLNSQPQATNRLLIP